jgi:hypothetical protein
LVFFWKIHPPYSSKEDDTLSMSADYHPQWLIIIPSVINHYVWYSFLLNEHRLTGLTYRQFDISYFSSISSIRDYNQRLTTHFQTIFPQAIHLRQFISDNAKPQKYSNIHLIPDSSRAEIRYEDDLFEVLFANDKFKNFNLRNFLKNAKNVWKFIFSSLP